MCNFNIFSQIINVYIGQTWGEFESEKLGPTRFKMVRIQQGLDRFLDPQPSRVFLKE